MNLEEQHFTSNGMISRLWMVASAPELWLRIWLLQEYPCRIIWVNIPARSTMLKEKKGLVSQISKKLENTYACRIISSTGVCDACKGSNWGPALDVSWLYCLTEWIRLKNKGTKVPQPPSLNKILNEWVENRALCSFSGTTWKCRNGSLPTRRPHTNDSISDALTGSTDPDILLQKNIGWLNFSPRM